MMSYGKILVLFIVLIFSYTSGEALASGRTPTLIQQKASSKKPVKQKKVRVKGPRSAAKAQKDADKKEKQQDKDYAKFVKENQKRSIQIQTPEVQERMKQNIKNANANSKARRKSNSMRTKRAGQKYR